VRRRLDLKTIRRKRNTMPRNPLSLRSDILLGSGRRHFHLKSPHDALLTNPRLLGFCMLLILTVVDCRGEAKNLSHAASKLRSPARWLLIHGGNIFYGGVVALGPQNLHFMGCNIERNGVKEGSLTSINPSVLNELHNVWGI
jgi:hypothetical protein